VPELISAIVVAKPDPNQDHLGRTLESIARQTYASEAVQVLLVGCDVDAVTVPKDVEVLATRAPSEGAAMNRVLGATRGSVYVWSDEATVWAPERLERIADFFYHHPDTDACLAPLDATDGPDSSLDVWDRFGERIAVFLDAPFALGSLATRRHVFDLLQRCREIDLARWELLMRCSLTGRPIGRLDSPLGERLAPPQATVPELSCGRPPHPFVKEHLADLGPKDLFNHVTLRSVSDAYCLKAGLFNQHDFVMEALLAAAEAARIAQTDNTLYWQGLLHRRLGSFEASHERLARLGAHPVLPVVGEAATKLLGHPTDPDLRQLQEATTAVGEWNPLAFVELCRKCVQDAASPEAGRVARQLQATEFEHLIDYTFRAALRQA